MRKKALAIVAATAFAISAVGAGPASAASETDISKCVEDAGKLLATKYGSFSWVVRLPYWQAVLRASCVRVLP